MDKTIAKSILKNTAVLMSSQVITWTMSFLLLLFLPRYLGTVDYGRLYVAGSIMTIFLLFIDFGGRYSISKEVARNRDKVGEIAVDAIGIRIILWAISFIILIVFVMFTNYHRLEKALIIIYGISMLWEGIRKVLWSCFQGFEQMRFPSIGAITDQIFVTIAAITALLLGANFLIIGIIYTIGSFINFFIHLKYSYVIITEIPKFNFKGALGLVKKGIPYFFWSIFGIIYYRVDAIMLSFMTPETVVGAYGAAYRFFDILMFIPSIFSIAVFPILSRIYKDKENLASTTTKSIDFIVLAGIPVSILIFIFALNIIDLFYGLRQYSSSVIILKIFSVGVILVYIDMILGTAILASDKLKEWTLVAFGAVILNVGLNYIMIPYTQQYYHNGGIGAAIATLVTELFVMLWALKITPKENFYGAKPMTIIKALFAGIILFLIVYSLREIQIFWILEAIFGFIIYLILLLLFKVFEPKEVEFFKEYSTLKNLKNIILPTKDIK